MKTKEKSRTCKIIEEDGYRLLKITETIGTRDPKKVTIYYKLENNPNARNAWRLIKLIHSDEKPVVYDVNLFGRYPSCDCLGNTSHGHCKHIESLQCLDNNGKLKK